MKLRSFLLISLVTLLLLAASPLAYTGPGNRTITTTGNTCWRVRDAVTWDIVDHSCTWNPDIKQYDNNPAYVIIPYTNTSTTTYEPASINAVALCAVPGNAGWCKSAPQVNFTVNEPIPGESIFNVEGTVNSGALQTFCNVNAPSGTCSWIPSEGVSNLSAWAVSSFGDTSLAANLVTRADRVAPVLSVPLTPNGANGWYTIAPTITLSASDATSGIASAQFDTGSNTFTPASDGIYTLTATALDVAGNSTSANITVKLDGTLPSLSIPTAPDGKNDWYKSRPTLTLSASDVTSGLDFAAFDLSGSNTFTPATDGAFNLAATARDLAGNIAKKTATLKVDSTPPLLSLPTAPDGANGWYITAPTLTLSASDATSGLASASLDTGGTSITITQDGIHTLKASGEDNAGNTASLSVTVKKDTVTPALSIPTAPDGDNGWYKSRPTITISASDATSGLDIAQFDTGSNTFTPSADGIFTLNATAKDLAGNTTTRSATIKVDATAPTMTMPVSPNGANGWYTSPTLTFTLSAADSGSGLKFARFTDAGGAVLVNDTTVTITADGTYTLQATAQDNAGNIRNLSVTIKKDGTLPTSILNPWPPDGLADWFTYRPTFQLSGMDVTSGVDKAFFTSTNTDSFTPPADGIYPLTGKVVDLAGNTASQDFTLKIDALPPALTVLSSPAVPDGTNGWYRTLPNLSLNASDATSGLDFARFEMAGNPDTYTPPGDGLFALDVLAQDIAGNSSSEKISLKVDTTAPTISIPVAPDGQNGWYITSPTLTFQANDATSGLESAAFSDGSTSITLDDGEYLIEARATDRAGNQQVATQAVWVDTVPPELTLAVNNEPVVDGWYGVPVQASAGALDHGSGMALLEHQVNGGSWTTDEVVDVAQSGVNLVSYRAFDHAGNHALVSRTLKVDTTAPVITVTAPSSLANLSELVSIQGSASDAHSGLATLAYSLDGGLTWLALDPGDWSFEWDTTTVPDGPFDIQLQATDRVGNRRLELLHVNVSNQPPFVALQESWQAWEAGSLTVHPRNNVPIERIILTVSCAPAHPDAVQTFGPDNLPAAFQWDMRCGDGAYASFASEFQATLTACDIFGRCASARGKIILPEMQSTATVTATVQPTVTATGTPSPSPTATAVVIIPTSLVQEPAPEPVKLHWWWIIATVSGLYLVFGANSLVDPRPAAIRRLRKTWQEIGRDG